MDNIFFGIIEEMVKAHGKDSLLDKRRFKSLILDFTRNEFKKETNLLRLMIDAGCTQFINNVDNVTDAKTLLVKRLEEENDISPKSSAKMLDFLGFVLRGVKNTTVEASVLNKTSVTSVVTTPSNDGQPEIICKELISKISMIHETFARLTTTSLSEQLRSMVYVNVVSVEQLTYKEFIRSIPTMTTLAIINMTPLKGNAILGIDRVITFSIIDRLFGGWEGYIRHELTDIETSVMEGIIVRILANLREAWSTVINLRPLLGQTDTNPQFAQIVPPTEMVILVTLKTKISDVEGVMYFCIPCSIIESIFNSKNLNPTA